jgi:hypothetical protein
MRASSHRQALIFNYFSRGGLCVSYTFLLEQGAESSAASFSDIPAFVLSRLSLTDEQACCNGSGTESSRSSPSGMTLRRSTGDRGMDSLTWYAEDSPVRTYLPLEKAKESGVSEADCGPSSPGSLAKFNPASYSWKTAQCSLFGGLMRLAETWPRWGMMRDGELFPLPTPSGLSLLREIISRHSTTFGSESGSVQRAPTPTKDDAHNVTRDSGEFKSLTREVRRVPMPRSEDSQCAGGHRDKNDTLYGLICRPKVSRLMTPNKRDWKDSGSSQGNRHSPNLGTQVHRIPTLHGFSKDGQSNGPSGNELGRAVNRLPTCTTMDHIERTSMRPSRAETGRKTGYLSETIQRVPTPTVACATGGQTSRGGERKDEPLLAGVAGGSLNPDWVEWLHGWPIGWTALAPLAMDKFQQWLDSHGGS